MLFRLRNPFSSFPSPATPAKNSRVHLNGVGPEPLQELPELRRLVAGWAETWGLPGIEQRLDITFDTRFRTSLGRCVPSERRIRLASFLLTGPTALLHEALCHEAAHAAAYELHGNGRRPHGHEWRALMRAADFEPRARIPADLLPDLPPHRVQRGARWEYRCPVCDASRLARRRVSGWHCTACRAAGMDGALVVTRANLSRRADSQEVSE